MFTGLIEDVGRVTALDRRGDAGLLRLETVLLTAGTLVGDSIAVNGVCLTVTSVSGTALSFDVSPESLSRTMLGSLKSGSSVNLERAVKLGDRMGGHIVTGHVDCIATLTAIKENSGSRVLDFAAPALSMRYLVEKGSVTVDGISLTVNSAGNENFSVSIIPHTFTATTLSKLRVGDRVNIETDIIGKYVERLTQPRGGTGGLSVKTLAEHGFI